MTFAERRTIKRRIDRMVPGFGRFCKRSGAKTMAEHRARLALLDRLIEADQIDAIAMLARDEITWAELRQADRKKRLHSDALAADVALSRGLWDVESAPGAFTKTLPRMGKTESSRARYELAFVHLKTYGADFLPGNAIVKDLKTVDWPAVWASMHQLSPASRNRVRSALSAFLTVFLGDKYHPFRRDVMKACGGMEDEQTAPREVTLGEFWTLLNEMNDAVKPSFIVLAATGMRVGEYLQCTEASIKRLPSIWIPAGKTGGRETSVAPELIPFVKQAIPCRVAKAPATWRGVQYDARYKRLYKAFAAASQATGIEGSPHVLRHLYAQLGTAELPTELVRQGLGHARSAMTDRYAKRRTTQRVASTVARALMRPKGVRVKVRESVQRGTR